MTELCESKERGLFDRFASAVSDHIAQAWFFALCAALVAGWLIGLPFAGWDNSLFHLVLNSPTTIVTFLMVALLQNSQKRSEVAMHKKLDALATALRDFMEYEIDDDNDDFVDDIEDLETAVGLEDQVGT